MLRHTLRTAEFERPAVTQSKTSPVQKTVNFIVGAAMLVMLFPMGGKLPEKPAGVRTALELVSKKQSAFQTLTYSAQA